ncbi:MAG TPA: MraY family glycosyltransferase [Phycisphaerae bacterium]|jgi:UDP-GlcNAc:undecaprenyl-phosphate GlcNAc-1-phosphate transferase
MSLHDIAQAYWPILAVAFGVSVIMTPICRWFALKRKIVDRPDDFLKPHKRPIPYLGGVAIFAGWSAGLITALLRYPPAVGPTIGLGDRPSIYSPMLLSILAAGAVITALGLADDLRILSPKIKLAGNVVAAFILLQAGIGTDVAAIIAGSLKTPFLDYPHWLIVLYSVPISVFIIVGACNATNLIDGMDGLCSGVLAIISFGFLVLAVNIHLYADWPPNFVLRVIIALAMMGSALGFTPYNRNPATIFMGDAGSMLLGLNAAIMLLLFADLYNFRWLLASLMVFGLPLADMLLTLARRWRSEKPLMTGDRSHFYDQLFDRGMSVRQVVGISYALATAFAALGCVSIFIRTRYVIALYALAVVATIWAMAKLRMCRADRT